MNEQESRIKEFAAVRQAGFQETDIVSMARPITKLAMKVGAVHDLPKALEIALSTALSDRMGPVLLDVPMNVQKELLRD